MLNYFVVLNLLFVVKIILYVKFSYLKPFTGKNEQQKLSILFHNAKVLISQFLG